jgi:hypothetical protein
MPDRPRLVRPPAVQLNSRSIVLLGTVLWFVAFVALVCAQVWAQNWAEADGHREWLWTALAGWILGLVGLLLIGKHRREGRTR